jgi:hypothetical protein
MPPVKTAAGQDELTHRSGGLGQRHRTLLLLVDGHRSSAEILRLARQAGVPDRCFDDLVSLGLVAPMAPRSRPPRLTQLKLRRATSRDELEALLDEVEQRMRKPRKLIVAAQTMRHVRHLPSLPGSWARP